MISVFFKMIESGVRQLFLESGGAALFSLSWITDLIGSVVAARELCCFFDVTALGVEHKRSTCFWISCWASVSTMWGVDMYLPSGSKYAWTPLHVARIFEHMLVPTPLPYYNLHQMRMQTPKKCTSIALNYILQLGQCLHVQWHLMPSFSSSGDVWSLGTVYVRSPSWTSRPSGWCRTSSSSCIFCSFQIPDGYTEAVLFRPFGNQVLVWAFSSCKHSHSY